MLTTVCANDKFGSSCEQSCGNCKAGDHCHHVNGSCLKGCSPGYIGTFCQQRKRFCFLNQVILKKKEKSSFMEAAWLRKTLQ